MTKTPARRILAVVLAIAAPPISIGMGAVGFFGSAILIDQVAIAATIGLLFCFGTGFLLLRPALRRRVPALIASGIGTALIGALIGATAFVPIDYGFRAAEAPAGTQYWDLPTGSRIAYLHAEPTGVPRGEAIIVLHGGPGTPGEGLPPGAEQWAAAGFDVYAYDQLGAGRSTRLADVAGYTVARQVANLEAIRAEIGVESITLIGRSWGASLAAQYVATHPERVDRVVLVSPGELWPGAFDEPVSDPWATLPAAQRDEFDELLSSPRVVLAALLQGLNPQTAHSFMGDAEADALLHASAAIGKDAGVCPHEVAPDPHRNPQGYYVNQLTVEDFASVPDPRPTLRELDLPVLVVRGECDFVIPEVASAYVEVFDATFVVIAGAGHSVMTAGPPAYLDALSAFLVD